MSSVNSPVAGGAEGRVALAHRQARLGLIPVVGFLLAGAVVAVLPHDTGRWLPLHLLLAGAVLGVISAIAPMLAATWSAAPPAPAWLAAVQQGAVAGGAVLVTVGRERRHDAATMIGAACTTIGLVLLIVVLLMIRRRGSVGRYRPAVDGYLAALALGTAGVLVGAWLAHGVDAEWWLRVRAAHLTLNVFGFVGVLIAATLPFFSATLLRMKMSPVATATRLRAVTLVLVAATATATAGRLSDSRWLTALGFVAYALGIIGVAWLCPRPRRKQLRWAGPRVVQVGLAVGWWVVICGWLAVTAWRARPEQRPLLALVVGVIVPIVLASLGYLGPVLRGGGHQLLTAGFATTRSWIGVGSTLVAPVLALAGRNTALAVVLLVWTADFAVRAVALLRAWPRRQHTV